MISISEAHLIILLADIYNSTYALLVLKYLEDNGYSPHTASVLMKQMFMTAFPRLVDDGPHVTEDNVEEYLIRQRRVMNSYAEHKKKTTLLGTFARSAGGYHGHGWW